MKTLKSILVAVALTVAATVSAQTLKMEPQVVGVTTYEASTAINLVVVKPENAEAEWVKALEKVIYTQEVYDLIVNAGFAPTFTPAE